MNKTSHPGHPAHQPGRREFHRMGVALALGLAGLRAHAQAPAAASLGPWPSRPLRIITPSPAGVGADAFARVYADRLSKALGTPAIVENRPGALSTIGADQVARSAPDGHTMLFSVGNPFTTSPHLLSRLPYNPERDFTPVIQLYGGGSFIVTNLNAPFRSLTEMIAMAKATPGKFSFASYGSGSTAHLGFELLQDAAGIDLLHVPYKSSMAMNDVMSGQVQMGWEPPISALQLIRAGKVRAIAFSGHKRSPSQPDVPTISEVLPGVELLSWVGVWVPSATPQPVVQKLQESFTAITQSPDLRTLFSEVGSDPIVSTTEAMAAYIRRESQILGRLIKAKNIKID